MDALREMGDKVNTLNEDLRPIETELEENLLWLPNIPHESVPVAMGEEGNVPHTPEGEFQSLILSPRHIGI